jgi:hemerythrin superfamily protein
MAKASKKPPRLPAADELKLSDPTDASAGESPGGATLSTEQDADALLKQDHREVERLFKEFEDSDDVARKRELAREICKELTIHAKLEEEIFYPACREKGVEDDVLDKAQVEHDVVKVLVADILSRNPDSPFYDAKLTVLSDLVKAHVAEEEKLLLGIFAGARKAGIDMAALGTRLKERKERLAAQAVDDIEPPPVRALRAEAGASQRYRREEKDMERWNERDERGGYMGSDDDDRRFSRGRYSSSQDDDNGGRYSRRGHGGRSSENDRDWGGSQRGSQGEGGRFGSGYGRSGGSEDDSRYGGAGGGGSGGWSGARSGGYSGRTGGFNDDDDYGRGGSRYGESGGYVTGYGGGYGSGTGGGMGGTQDYPRSSRRGGYRGYGSGESEESSGRGYGGESRYSRGGHGNYGNYGSSGDDDYSSRGSRSGRGGFTREREEYGRYRGEDDREWSGGRQGGRRGSGPYRDD